MANIIGAGSASGSALKKISSANKNTSKATSNISASSKNIPSDTGASSSSSNYGNNYYGYGSKEAYAKAIERKLASGEKLSNPEAAAEFMRENPGLVNVSASSPSKTSTGSKSSSGSSGSSGGSGSLTGALGTAGSIIGSAIPGPAGALTKAAIGGATTALTADMGNKNGLPSKKTAQTIWNSTTGKSSTSSGSSSGGGSTIPSAPSAPPTQTIGAPKTDIDVEAGTPSFVSTTSTVPEAMSRTSAGFAEYVNPIASVPTSDDLYRLYKEITGGQENEAVRQYLNSADFQAVLGGQIPLWMQTDPVWRLYLQRLGIWSPSPRISAMQRYLNSQR